MNEFIVNLKEERFGLSNSDELRDNLRKYIDGLKIAIWDKNYSCNEASLILSTDSSILNNIKENLSNEKPKYIFLVGIGGPNLGTYAIDMVLKNSNDDCEIIFIDTITDINFEKVRKVFNSGNITKPEDFIILLISKSGGTTETIANAEYLDSLVSEKGYETNSRTIIISGDDSKLSTFAKNNSIRQFSVPEMVGGRYSVLSNIGLVPLYLKYGDVVQGLLDGAIAALWHNDDNQKYIDQVERILAAKQNGINIMNHFFFNKEFEGIGKWVRQLYGESLGKEKDIEGNVVHEGILPITSIGSNDLHSMAQLYFGGPRNIYTQFFYFRSDQNNEISRSMKYNGLVEGIGGKSLEQIMDAIYSGVIDTYNSLELPFIEIKTKGSKAYAVGYFLQYKMIEVMLLAKALNLNAFDQPSVEQYKINTKKYLQN